MELKRLTGTFGVLEEDTLVLSPGLNLIHAPNESGKSTWCALLRVMLYGLSTRARGAAADKNRYAPWSGRPMQGVLEVAANGVDLTVTRTTQRSNAPMGAFSALRTGTADPVSGVTAATCGEFLTGVPREVFERSAFIRQSGLAIDQDPELERRIAALITSGEEDTSYIEAEERLRKQLNRRRHNKTGLLPQLEREMAELRSAEDTGSQLKAQLTEAQEAVEALEQQQRKLERQRALQAQEGQAQADAAVAAQEERVRAAEEAVNALRLSAAGVPDRSALEQALGTLATLTASQATADRAAQSLAAKERQAEEARRQREAAEAQMEPPVSERSGGLPAALLAALLVGVLAGAAAYFLAPDILLPAALGGLILTAAVAVPLALRRRKASRQEREQAEAAQTQVVSQARQAYDQAQAALVEARQLWEDLDGALRQSTESVFALFPQIPRGDLEGVKRAARAGLTLHQQLSQAEAETAEARQQLALARQAPRQEAGPIDGALREVADRLHAAQGTLQYLSGRMQALGDPAQLEVERAEKEEQHRCLTGEYEALRLALDALADANSQLQGRFSPELGKKSAKIFAKLTNEKYNKVLLSRELAASAGTAEESVVHDVLQLSQGTADQLYLAVRLAVCDMVLPADHPLILDDALTSFDDERMEAALRYLMEISRQRQILLFTCQEREGQYLAQAFPGQYHTISFSKQESKI